MPAGPAAGHILLFDNGWGPPMRGWSQVLEIEPASGEIVWEYWNPDGDSCYRTARYAPESEAIRALWGAT